MLPPEAADCGNVAGLRGSGGGGLVVELVPAAPSHKSPWAVDVNADQPQLRNLTIKLISYSSTRALPKHDEAEIKRSEEVGVPPRPPWKRVGAAAPQPPSRPAFCRAGPSLVENTTAESTSGWAEALFHPECIAPPAHSHITEGLLGHLGQGRQTDSGQGGCLSGCQPMALRSFSLPLCPSPGQWIKRGASSKEEAPALKQQGCFSLLLFPVHFYYPNEERNTEESPGKEENPPLNKSPE